MDLLPIALVAGGAAYLLTRKGAPEAPPSSAPAVPAATSSPGTLSPTVPEEPAFVTAPPDTTSTPPDTTSTPPVYQPPLSTLPPLPRPPHVVVQPPSAPPAIPPPMRPSMFQLPSGRQAGAPRAPREITPGPTLVSTIPATPTMRVSLTMPALAPVAARTAVALPNFATVAVPQRFQGAQLPVAVPAVVKSMAASSSSGVVLQAGSGTKKALGGLGCSPCQAKARAAQAQQMGRLGLMATVVENRGLGGIWDDITSGAGDVVDLFKGVTEGYKNLQTPGAPAPAAGQPAIQVVTQPPPPGYYPPPQPQTNYTPWLIGGGIALALGVVLVGTLK